MNYTKGKWEARRGGMIVIENKEGFESTAHHPIFVVAQCGIYNTVPSTDECEVNARLIAQSPRMAEWIEKIVRQNFVTFPEDRIEAKEILKALAEAE